MNSKEQKLKRKISRITKKASLASIRNQQALFDLNNQKAIAERLINAEFTKVTKVLKEQQDHLLQVVHTKHENLIRQCNTDNSELNKFVSELYLADRTLGVIVDVDTKTIAKDVAQIDRGVLALLNQRMTYNNSIKVSFNEKLMFQSIQKHGQILTPSSSHSSYTGSFKNDQHVLTLIIKTSDNQVYIYGGLSITVEINPIECLTKAKGLMTLTSSVAPMTLTSSVAPMTLTSSVAPMTLTSSVAPMASAPVYISTPMPSAPVYIPTFSANEPTFLTNMPTTSMPYIPTFLENESTFSANESPFSANEPTFLTNMPTTSMPYIPTFLENESTFSANESPFSANEPTFLTNMPTTSMPYIPTFLENESTFSANESTFLTNMPATSEPYMPTFSADESTFSANESTFSKIVPTTPTQYISTFSASEPTRPVKFRRIETELSLEDILYNQDLHHNSDKPIHEATKTDDEKTDEKTDEETDKETDEETDEGTYGYTIIRHNQTYTVKIHNRGNGIYIINITPRKLHINSRVDITLNGLLIKNLNPYNVCEIINHTEYDLSSFSGGVYRSGRRLYQEQFGVINQIDKKDGRFTKKYLDVFTRVLKNTLKGSCMCFWENYMYIMDAISNSIYKYDSSGNCVSIITNNIKNIPSFQVARKIHVYITQDNQELIIIINQKHFAQRIVIINGFGKIIGVVINNLINMQEFECVIGSYIERSSNESNLDVIRIFNKNRYTRSKVMQYYKIDGTFIKTHEFEQNLYHVHVTNEYIVTMQHVEIVIYNTQMTRVCSINVQKIYDLLDVEDHKLFAYYDCTKKLSVWDISI